MTKAWTSGAIAISLSQGDLSGLQLASIAPGTVPLPAAVFPGIVGGAALMMRAARRLSR